MHFMCTLFSGERFRIIGPLIYGFNCNMLYVQLTENVRKTGPGIEPGTSGSLVRRCTSRIPPWRNTGLTRTAFLYAINNYLRGTRRLHNLLNDPRIKIKFPGGVFLRFSARFSVGFAVRKRMD